jgi:hypothetical protein
MDATFTPSDAITAGGKDCAQVFVGFRAIPIAVLDAALKPFSQRIMELAISAAESANTAVATNMGVSGKALKPERHPRWLPNTLLAQSSFNSFGVACNP